MSPVTCGTGAVFMFHHVRKLENRSFSPNYHLNVTPEFLDKMITSLKNKGHEFITMDDVALRLQHPKQYENAPPFAALTLDDGYRDNAENAVPVFQKHNVPYMIYVATGITERESMLWWEDLEHVIAARNNMHVDLPDGRIEFDLSTTSKKQTAYKQLVNHLLADVDEREQRKIVASIAKYNDFDQRAHADREIMDWRDINELIKDPLCSIGAHTINHYILSKLSEEDALFEMRQSLKVLEQEIGYAPEHFAYPYGMKFAAGKREFELAKKIGFKTAVTTRHGVIFPEHKDHMTALPRVSVNGNHQSMHYITTMLSGIPGMIANYGKRINVT